MIDLRTRKTTKLYQNKNNNYVKNLEILEEPKLTFNYGQKVIDPRDGLTLFGPYSKDYVNDFNVGLIGTVSGRLKMQTWLKGLMKPMYPLKHNISKPFYPGFKELFGVGINFRSIVELDIKASIIEEYCRYSDGFIRVGYL